MANTYVDYTGDNSETDFIFNFDYLQNDHVKVKVNDAIVTNYSIVEVSADNVIRFNTAPASNASIRIYRDSRGDFSPLVDFVDGSVLTGDNLDEAYKHNLFVSQEASEGTGNELLNKKGGANYDAEGNKIINLGTPTDATDAANKGYVDQTIDNSIALGGSPAIVSLGGYDVTAFGTSITKSLANWTNDLNSPTATGSSTARSLADRFSDVINVKDYGAKGNGSDDDTDAVQAAITAARLGGVVFFPKGEYVVSSLTHTGPNISFLGTNAGNATNRTSTELYSSTIRFTETTNNAFTFTAQSYFSKNIAFRNLGIFANTSGYAIDFDKYGELTFEDCLIDNKGTGGGINCFNVYSLSFYDCFITKSANQRSSGSVGVQLDNAILGGIFNFFTSNITEFSTGLNINSVYNDEANLESFNFVGSQAKNCTTGLDLSGGLNSGSISGSYFEGNSLNSVQLRSGVENFLISGCFFNDPFSVGTSIRVGKAGSGGGGVLTDDDKVRNVTISNCNFFQINKYGIIQRADPAFGGNININNCQFSKYSSSSNTVYGILNQTSGVLSVSDCNFENLDIDFGGASTARRINSSGVYQNACVIKDLASTETLTAESPVILTYNPTGTGNKNVLLPAIADAVGKEFLISCNPSSSFSLLVKDSSNSTTYQTLAAGESCKVWNDGVSQFTYKF